MSSHWQLIGTRGRLDRNVAPCSRPTTNVIGPLHECKKVCPWMQESVSMNARKCVHECKKVCPCTKALPQSGIRAWIKQGRRKRKKRGRETGKTEARRLMERKAKQKHIWGTKKFHTLKQYYLIPNSYTKPFKLYCVFTYCKCRHLTKCHMFLLVYS